MNTLIALLLLWMFGITPNDPEFNEQWGLHSANDADINAPEAWEIETGDASIILSIIDTGLDDEDETHPEFQGRLVAGWNFIDNNANFLDEKGHGTNVAGIAAAITDNNTGVAGVDWYAQIVSKKIDVFEDQELYADAGAQVINNSRESDKSMWSIVGGIGLSRYSLSEEFGISAGLGVDCELSPRIALRISGKYSHTKRDLYLAYPGSPMVYPPDEEKVCNYSLEISGILYSRSQKFFIGLGQSFHYYDLFRTGSWLVGWQFPEGEDVETRICLGVLLGFKVNVMGGPFSLGLEVSGVEDFKGRFSRRSLSLCPTFYWR